MTLKNLQNKKIALLGLGVENFALLNYCLKNKVRADFTICDLRSTEALGDKFQVLNKYANVFWQLGEEFNQKLDRYDILFRSPGWPIACSGIQGALKNKKKIILTSPMKLFFDLCPTRNIIGVTGTKGKGTTSSLIFSILNEDLKNVDSRLASLSGMTKPRVYLGGNIGIAPFEFLPKLKKTDWVVLELSSFQLEDLHKSPQIAVFTNFTPEHLAPADPNNPNYHKSLSEYLKAKFNITSWQKTNDFLILNDKFQISNFSPFAKASEDRQTISKSKPARPSGGFPITTKARICYFTKSDFPSQLPGEHNKENIAASEMVAQILKISPEIVMKAVAKFKGLEHRLELVSEKKGVKYYDDSFATTPESAIIALKSFSQPIVLLAGGADKGADFQSFAKEIKKRVKFVILFDGVATPRIKKALLALGYQGVNIKVVKSMAEAVALGQKKAIVGDVVLLSTACASFGIFKNYKERGNQFKAVVNKF